MKIDKRFLGSWRFKRTLSRAYELGEQRVELFLGYDDLLDRSRHPISPKLAVPGTGSAQVERERIEIEGIPQPIVSVLARSGGRLMLAYSWYEGSKSLPEEILRSVLAIDRSPLRRTTGIAAARLATPLGPEGRGRVAAEKRLRQFARRLHSMIEEEMIRVAKETQQRPG